MRIFWEQNLWRTFIGSSSETSPERLRINNQEYQHKPGQQPVEPLRD